VQANLVSGTNIKTVNSTSLLGSGNIVVGGKVVQVVNFQTGARATGTTVMPWDDTIPQITEGNEYMTLAITPTSASNILIVSFVAIFSTNNAQYCVGALFMGSTADALAANQLQTVANSSTSITLTHKMTAGATSALTFRVRVGGWAAGTTTFNGYAAARKLGGALASSITITEYAT